MSSSFRQLIACLEESNSVGGEGLGKRMSVMSRVYEYDDGEIQVGYDDAGCFRMNYGGA